MSDDDQHDRALGIARNKRETGDLQGALRFAKKAAGMRESKEATFLIGAIEKDIASGGSSSASTATASDATSHPSSSTTHARPGHSSSSASSSASPVPPKPSRTSSSSSAPPLPEKREYTADNVTVVKRVRACKAHQYYEILSLEKTCSDGEVKKAYRKLALALHPDKNGAPGADEAFKLVSKAFQILSDPDKRAVYDREGGDPDARPQMSSRGFGGGGMGGRGGGFHGGGGAEINPEDLFNAFFGGGFGGGGGFGQPQTFSFGSGGFNQPRVYRTQTRHQQPRRAADGPPPSIWVQLLPLLFILAFSLISFLPSLLDNSPPTPSFAYEPHPPAYTNLRTTAKNGVAYYVDNAFKEHPIYQSVPEEKRGARESVYSSKLRGFENDVEMGYARQLQGQCSMERSRRDEKIRIASGFFGIGSDWEEVRRLQRDPLVSCERLQKMGLRTQNVQYY